MSKILPCPNCGREVDYRYTDTNQQARMYFYKCKNDACRNHFKAVELPGVPLQVTSQSAPDSRRPPPMVGLMNCPSCGAYGKIKTSHRREDGYWRRHQCLSCGPYHTLENEEGISVHKKLKALNPIDN